MSTSLSMLFAVTILAIFSFIPYSFAYLSKWGIAGIVGNRKDMPPLPNWAERAKAAHRNLTENYAHFAVLVLLANHLALSTELVALGAMLFFWSRLAFVIVYILGIPWVRSLVFVTGMAGELMIAFEIVNSAM